MILTEDEMACLLIAVQGAPLIPIGRWKPAIEHLIQLGYLRPQGHPGDPSGNFNCCITDAGRWECEKQDQEDQDAFRAAVNRIKQAGPPVPPTEIPVPVTVGQPAFKKLLKRFCPHCGGELDGQ